MEKDNIFKEPENDEWMNAINTPLKKFLDWWIEKE